MNITSSYTERKDVINLEARKELIKRRTELSYTHDVVAEKSQISRAYYSNVEAGRKDPSMRVMKRIADALKTKVDIIFFD